MTAQNLTGAEKEMIVLMLDSGVTEGSEAEKDLETIIFHPDHSDTQKMTSVVDYLKGYMVGKKEASL